MLLVYTDDNGTFEIISTTHKTYRTGQAISCPITIPIGSHITPNTQAATTPIKIAEITHSVNKFVKIPRTQMLPK